MSENWRMARVLFTVVVNIIFLADGVLRQMSIMPFFKYTLIIFCIMEFLDISPLHIYAEGPLEKEYIEEKYLLGSEDVIDIKIWNHDSLNKTIVIPKEGSFTFPHIGKVNATGISVFELENLMEKRLSDGYLRSPQVSITVQAHRSHKVFLLGQVKNPGVYFVKGDIHILELILKAGGFTDNAGGTVTIVRPKTPRDVGPAKPYAGDKKNIIIDIDIGEYTENSKSDNFIVHNEDYIYVNKNKESVFFVNGQVHVPGKFDWKKGMTVRKAIALAEGATELANKKRIKIIRLMNGKEEIIKAKLDDAVEPEDVIEVPERYF